MKTYRTLLGGDEPFWFVVSSGERVVITRLMDNVVVFDRTYTSDAVDSFIDADSSGFWIANDYKVDVYYGNQSYTFYIHSIARESVYTIRLLDYRGQVGAHYKKFVQYTSPDGKVYVAADDKWIADGYVYVPGGWSVVVIYKVTDAAGQRPHTYGQLSVNNISSNYDVTGAYVSTDFVVVERTYRVSVKWVRDVAGDVGMTLLSWAVGAANPLLAFVGGGIASILAQVGVYGVQYVKEVRVEGDYVYVTVGQTLDVYNIDLLVVVLFILLGALILSYVSNIVSSISQAEAKKREAEITSQIIQFKEKAMDYASQVCGNNVDCVQKTYSLLTEEAPRSVKVASVPAVEAVSWFSSIPWWGWLLVGLFLALLLTR